LVKIPDIHLVLVGSGDIDKFVPFTLPFRTRITFTGKLNSKELTKWYHISDIGVLPSLHEQCSFTAIEMRFHKIPLIVSDLDGLKEMFTHEYDALKLSVNLDKEGKKVLDVSEFAEYMERLLKDQDLANQLTENSYKVAIKSFKAESMQQKYLSLLATMC